METEIASGDPKDASLPPLEPAHERQGPGTLSEVVDGHTSTSEPQPIENVNATTQLIQGTASPPDPAAPLPPTHDDERDVFPLKPVKFFDESTETYRSVKILMQNTLC